MRKVFRIFAVVVFVCALAFTYFTITEARRPPDEEQIRALLEKGESAIERKDMTDVMSCIASDYTDDAGNTYDGFRAEIQVYFLQQSKYEVEVKDTKIKVAKNTAIVSTMATVTLVDGGGGQNALYSRPVDLIFYKGNARRWLVLPVKRWKVTCITGMPQESDFEE